MTKKQEYLKSLLEWSTKVKDSLINYDDSDVNKWMEDLAKLEKLVHEGLEYGPDLTDQYLADVQAKSKQLMEDLKLILSNPRQENNQYVAPGNHTLPSLPYEYDALEPYISEKIMRLHHDEHHKSYVEGLNRAEKSIYNTDIDKKLIKHWLREQSFNGSGHYLHTIFWTNISPKGGGKPTGRLRNQLRKDFGSFEKFKKLFSSVAESVEGVGWAILVWEPNVGRLGVQSVEKHQLFNLADTIPLLVLDVWEHAYYLQYKNNRTDYIDNWWNVVNWSDVEHRLLKAKSH